MPVTIYADTLLFINIFITYFLLLCTDLLCRAEIRRVRILLAALLGGCYGLILLCPPIPFPLSVLLRCAVCAVLRWIADGFGSLRTFLRGLAVFLGVNFCFAGLMLALSLLLKSDGFLYSGGALYLQTDIPFLLCATAIAYGLLRLCSVLFASRLPHTHYGYCTIFADGKSIHGQGIFDTGHTMRDGFTGKPVLIARRDLLETLVPPEVFRFLSGKSLADCDVPPDWKNRLRLFPYSTVGQDGLLPAFRCDRAVLIHLNKTAELREIYIAAAVQPLRDCDLLFPGTLYDTIQEEGHEHAFQNRRSEKNHPAHPSVFHRTVRALHQRSADAARPAAQKRGGGDP